MAVKKNWLNGYDPVAAGEQDAYGTDLEGLRYNLRLTVAQRLEQHRRALLTYIAIRDAGIASRHKKAS